MTPRFASNVSVLLAGAFLAASALGFPPEVAGWLGLATGAFVVVVLMAAFATRGRGLAQRWLDVSALFVAAWTIVASRAFSGAALKWLMFSSGAVLLVVGLVGLIVHELLLEVTIRRAEEPPRQLQLAETDDSGARRPIGLAS